MKRSTFWLLTTFMTLTLGGGLVYLWLGDYGKNTLLMALLTLIVVNAIAKWIYAYSSEKSKKLML